ncbi:methyltransferase domain-containing protein [Pseudomonas corrugata]|uniref:Methyltransferase domain-containing protein n=1 Tax=Pseudomonas corrugata TaxID=47879 RepID=A0A7Y5Z571_9PSED|nr:methyltransferase domain-containing protein [Pseudomonas corrugata]NUT87300.1 methyltransferase domain-containing protein [Pseudomonas corrugata]
MTNFNADVYTPASVQRASANMAYGLSDVAHPSPLFLETPYSELWSRNVGSAVVSLSITADAALLVIACKNRNLKVLSRDCELLWSHRFADEITATAISCAHHIAVGTQRTSDGTGTVSLFNADGQELFNAVLESPVHSVSFSADGARLTILCKNQVHHIATRVENTYQLSQTRQPHLENSSHTDTLWALKDRALGGRHQDARTSSVAVSQGGTVAIGSLDGKIHLLNRQGKQLWSRQVDGEVWALGISENGSIIVSGCTDGTVKLLANHAHDAFNEQISIQQSIAERLDNAAEQRHAVNETLASLGQMGLTEYAANWLNEGALQLGQDNLDELAIKLLSEDVQRFPKHYTSHFLLAQAHQKRQEWHQAARHFTWAGQDERMKLQSFTLAGESFLNAGLPSAAKSAFRRARELTVTEEAKKTLYTLGRIHEEQGSVTEAQKYYEVVFTLNPNYLDVCARLQSLNAPSSQHTSRPNPEDTDWYGSLIHELLSPVSQRGFDLAPEDGVPHPRTTELTTVAEHRKRLLSIISEYALDSQDKVADAKLDYDVAAYMRYDCSVPEDEAKKSLELVNMLDCIKHYGPFSKSLDIGAATGRYPTLLAQQGIQAFGVDLEPMAVEYARQKSNGALNPNFHQGDARALPFESTQFDLITCMMGTAAHFPRQDVPTVLSEIHRCLVPGGFCVISTWDIECPHLTYLSIYSHEQKELMRQNAISRADASKMATAQGFVVEEIRSLGLFPESLGYELDLQQDGPYRIKNLLDMDLAFKAKFPNLHGQMYMLIIRKI